MIDVQLVNSFISGTLMLGYWVGGLFFFNFWRQTGDNLFRKFGYALWLLMAERLLLLFVSQANEFRPYVYIFRLAAFVLIFVAVLKKNSGARAAQ